MTYPVLIKRPEVLSRWAGMSLLIRNLQRAVRFNQRKMRRDVETIRKIMNIHIFDVSISCVDNETIRKMNGQYRKMDQTTDVLSFSFHDFTEPFDPSTMKLGANKDKSSLENGPSPPRNGTADPFLEMLEVPDLGDVYFGMPHIHEFCVRKGIQLEDELVVLATHGFAHLLGYDHEASMEDFKTMYLFEFDILRKFDWATGRNTLAVKEMTLDDGHC